LNNYMDRDSEYPQFKERIERYVAHSIDLIHAIRAKRRFPGLGNLTIAKQQELGDKFREHYNELQKVLKKIEKIQIELRLEDIRSTVWVVKALVNAIVAVALLAFFVEASRGLILNFWVVIDDSFVRMIDSVFIFLKL
jgi:hypothetical protein